MPSNMAFQRTRRPSLRSGRSLRSLGSPLTAYPLGATTLIVFGDRGSRDAQWDLVFMPLALLDLPVAVLAYPLGFGVTWALKSLGVPLEGTLVMVAVANGLV